MRADTLHDIEHGGNENADIAAFIADRIVRCHLRTMARMNVDYDLLTWEGDILRLKFWAQAFEVLKSKRAVHLRTEGTAGRLLGHADSGGLGKLPSSNSQLPGLQGPTAQPLRSLPEAQAEEEEEREKVIVRSNGVVTYVGKDIAYQFWKLGLLGRDFKYRVFAPATGGSAVGDDQHGRGHGPPTVMAGRRYVYNVIDVRQSYLQKLLKQALIAVGHPEGARAVAPLLVRDGGAVTRQRARAGICAGAGFRRCQATVRRGLRAERAWGSKPTTCWIP